jgi:hypothetical protein
VPLFLPHQIPFFKYHIHMSDSAYGMPADDNKYKYSDISISHRTNDLKTDGIWQTTNAEGHQYGRKKFTAVPITRTVNSIIPMAFKPSRSFNLRNRMTKVAMQGKNMDRITLPVMN